MRLASIKPGDIVRVHDGLPYFAEVIERDGTLVRVERDGTLVRVAPITGPRGVRTVTSRKVVEHWRRAGTTRVSGAGFAPSTSHEETSPPSEPDSR